MKIHLQFSILLAVVLLAGGSVNAQDDLPFDVSVVTAFDEPWALAFLPDGRMLVTEKKGNLFIVTQDGEKSRAIGGLPDVDYGGQGGLGDVMVHPDFAETGVIYLSYVEGGVGDTRGAAVMRAVLNFTDRGGYLSDADVVWRQYPKVMGFGHYGHRLLLGPDGYLWISSGDRQKFTPAQHMQSSMGKILRLHEDGSIPDDNPFVNYIDEDPLVDDVGVYGEFWSMGHRNPLGIAFDLDGQLWCIEMGPAGGDELNRVVRGGNYGYPVVSNGDHYDGSTAVRCSTIGRATFLLPDSRRKAWCALKFGATRLARSSAIPWALVFEVSPRGPTVRYGSSRMNAGRARGACSG
jgi:glucose/arabinose dehydrogenase